MFISLVNITNLTIKQRKEGEEIRNDTNLLCIMVRLIMKIDEMIILKMKLNLINQKKKGTKMKTTKNNKHQKCKLILF